MTFLRGLFAARSHLAFLLGLGAAVLIVREIGRLTDATSPGEALAATAPGDAELPLRLSSPLTPGERSLARVAWRYVERNTDPRTGLASSVRGHPSTTMWDVGSQLLAILAAEDLGLVPRSEASGRLGAVLASLAAMPLCEGRLPNKAYHSQTLAMVDYANRPAPMGIGWSALDVARVLVPLRLVTWRHPELTPAVREVVGRWDLAALSDGAVLRGASRREDGALDTHQEGRLGYEQYAAKALVAWGVPVSDALDHGAHLALDHVDGEAVPVDDRHPRDHGGTHNAVASEPWVLDALEHGFDAASLPLARALLRVQERRAERTGRLTAVSEDHLDRAPWFTYSAVRNGDDDWIAVAPDGRRVEDGLTFSTKAAVGWGVLFEGSYPERLLAAAEELVERREGLLAGRYDASGEPNRALTLNTNAVVLEALAYRVHGPSLRHLGTPDVATAPRAATNGSGGKR